MPSVLISLLALSVAPYVFVHPDQLAAPQGVQLEAQIPESTEILIPPDPDRPTLWYAPGAVRKAEAGTEIYYQRVEKGAEDYSDQRTLCLAILGPNGLTLPDLHDAPPAWGGPNNVVMRRSPHPPTWGGFNVFQMAERDGALWLLYWDQPAEGEAGAMLARSDDGRSWEKLPGTVFTEHNDAYTLLEQNGKFLLYQTMLEEWPDKPYSDNLANWRRVQCIRESHDLENWTEQEVLLRPDDEDPPETEFYLMKVFPYHGYYLGLLMKYFGDPERPGEHSGIIRNELMVSKDGRDWQRPWRDTDLGFWSYPDPFMHEDKLTFVTWKDNGMNTFSYGPRRMTAVVADGDGKFATRPMDMHGDTWLLDADVRHGSLRVWAVDENGDPMKGWPSLEAKNTDTRELAAVPIHGLKVPLNGTVRLQVELTRGKLYAIGMTSREER